jgi:hypothetical protein
MRVFCLSFFLTLLLGSCAQGRRTIKESHAFFKQSFAGVQIRVIDMEGKETVQATDTVRIIYLKADQKNGRPVIDTILFGTRLYKGVTQPVLKDQYSVGHLKADKKPVRLSASGNDNIWWQITLVPAENLLPTLSAHDSILVKGHFGSHRFQIVIPQQIELEPDVRM